MPEYTIRDPQTGRSITIRGDSPPTEQELEQLFSTLNASDKPSTAMGAVQSLKDFMGEATQSLNPMNMVRGVNAAVTHPINTYHAVMGAQEKVRQQALDAYRRGDTTTALAKGVEWLIPFIGPRMSESGDMFQRGEYAKGLGASVDAAAQIVAPEVARRGGSVVVRRVVQPANQKIADAVAFARREGVPVDAATATGSGIVQRLQKRVTDSMGGARTAEAFKAEQAAALERTGRRLAERTRPGASGVPETAGQGVRDALQQRIDDFSMRQNAAYERLRKIEADPANTVTVQMQTPAANGAPAQTVAVQMQMPVDLRAAKVALRPIYERITRQMPVAEQRASAGLKAIQNILDSPDYLPASVADADLSAIKELARTSDGFRNVSQGVAAQAVKQLHAAVDAAVAKAGPAAVKALAEGRQMTVAKVGARDVLKGVREEPVQAYKQMTYANDAGVNKLREVASLAPAELPKVGRAFMEDLINTATAEGGFSKAQGLYTKWQALGPQTKAALFKDPALVQDIDRFFLLAKKIGENPNPSGTAGVLTALNATSAPATWALAKLFYSRRGVDLLTKGIRIPLGNKAAVAAWVSDVTRALGEAPGRGMVPATAGELPPEARREQRP